MQGRPYGFRARDQDGRTKVHGSGHRLCAGRTASYALAMQDAEIIEAMADDL